MPQTSHIIFDASIDSDTQNHLYPVIMSPLKYPLEPEPHTQEWIHLGRML